MCVKHSNFHVDVLYYTFQTFSHVNCSFWRVQDWDMKFRKSRLCKKNSNCGCRMNLNIEILIFNIEILIRNYLDCVASHKWRRIVGPHIYFSSQQSRFSLDLWFWTINFKVINLDVRTGYETFTEFLKRGAADLVIDIVIQWISCAKKMFGQRGN